MTMRGLDLLPVDRLPLPVVRPTGGMEAGFYTGEMVGKKGGLLLTPGAGFRLQAVEIGGAEMGAASRTLTHYTTG